MPVLLAAMTAACNRPYAAQKVESTAAGCVEHFDPERDYFPDKASIRHAKGIRLTYHGNYKLLEVNPAGKNRRTFRYVLVQCGTPAPKGIEADDVIEVPIHRLVLSSYVFESAVELFGLQDRLVGLDDINRVVMPGVVRAVEAGKVRQVGCCGHTDIETVAALRPDVVMGWFFDRSNEGREARFAEMGIKHVWLAQQPEPTPLATSEWLKAFAAFFNRDRDAEEYFAKIEREYQTLAARARVKTPKPVVLFGAPSREGWGVGSIDSAGTALIEDAGGAHFWPIQLPTAWEYQSFEAAYARARAADFWLYSGPRLKSIDDIPAKDARLASLRVVHQRQVFTATAMRSANGRNPYPVLKLIHPEWELEDLTAIFQPDLLPAHKPHFYERVAPSTGATR
jgi:iron complex transport system substrate-binding protein